MSEQTYDDGSIQSLDWKDHIRLRPGMYIGKLGDGSAHDDGIYVLVKEIIDNSIDEFVMGHGKRIEVEVADREVRIRDYGRGIPLGMVNDCVSKINTGAKYNNTVFKKAVGLNGVGTKAVNAMSSYFRVEAVRDGQSKYSVFEGGELVEDAAVQPSDEKNGTIVSFVPDQSLFGNFHFVSDYLEKMLWNYAYLNNGLAIHFNGQKFMAKNGLLDLLNNEISAGIYYPIIHMQFEDFEFAFTHYRQYGEEYYSFVNGQHTTQGGTHQSAFREAIVKTIRDFYNKSFEPSDIRGSIVAALSIKVQEPVFESQTKTKLGSQYMEKDGQSVRNFINEIVKENIDNYLHKHPDTAEALLQKILQNQKERKEMAGIKKKAKESAKKTSLHNKKLRDCRVHLTDSKHDDRLASTLFITEGDSASGSITKSRNVRSQAVFSLKGKPLNTYSKSKKVVYDNEEFNLLQAALDIDNDLDNLRYNNIVIATDADVDGMHIRLLLLTFFLKFYPDLIKRGHLYILQTPLFRVRNKKKTYYCYNEEEKAHAIEQLKGKPEITRFKGLGEISPDEFKHFIDKDMRIDPVILKKDTPIEELLSYYMGSNTPERQDFIIENLRLEEAI